MHAGCRRYNRYVHSHNVAIPIVSYTVDLHSGKMLSYDNNFHLYNKLYMHNCMQYTKNSVKMNLVHIIIKKSTHASAHMQFMMFKIYSKI